MSSTNNGPQEPKKDRHRRSQPITLRVGERRLVVDGWKARILRSAITDKLAACCRAQPTVAAADAVATAQTADRIEFLEELCSLIQAAVPSPLVGRRQRSPHPLASPVEKPVSVAASLWDEELDERPDGDR